MSRNDFVSRGKDAARHWDARLLNLDGMMLHSAAG